MNSDQWATDFDRANNLLITISEEVFKSPSYHKTLSGREIAITRGRVSQLEALISHLQRGLSFSNENEAPSNVSEIDLSKRDEAIKKLAKDLKKYQTRYFSAVAVKTSPTELESQIGTSTHEMVTKEATGELDYILDKVTNLKDLGFEINEEIDVQCRLIEDIESKEDEILSKSQYNQKKLDEYLKVKGTSLTTLWAIVVVLFMFFIFVLIY